MTSKIDLNRPKMLTQARREVDRICCIIRSITARKRLRKLLETFSSMVVNIQNCETSVKLLRQNNRNLARALQHEKLNTKNLLQEKIAAESSYHDLLREHTLQKKELQDMEQAILNYDEELKNSMIPNLVKLSDDVTKFKLKNNVLRKKIEMKSNLDSSLNRSSWSNISFNNGNQPPFAVGTVNPMIKGCVIQKPTINVRRVSLNQNRNQLFADIATSSPIMEEPEESAEVTSELSQRRTTNFTIRNRQSTQFVPVTAIDYNDTSGESETEIVTMEPTVRLCDVAQLLGNSTVQINKHEKPKDVSPTYNHCSPGVLLRRIRIPLCTNHESTAENPLEGCSWMSTNSSTKKCECGREYISLSQRTCDCATTCDADTSNRKSSSKKVPYNIDSPEIITSSIIASPQIHDSAASETRASTKAENESQRLFSSTLNNSRLLTSNKKKFFTVSPDRQLSVDNQRALTSTDPGILNDVNDTTMSILLQNCSRRKRRSSLCPNRLKTFTRKSNTIEEKENIDTESEEIVTESPNNEPNLRRSSRRCKRRSSYIDESPLDDEEYTSSKNSVQPKTKKRSKTASEKQSRSRCSRRSSGKRSASEITPGNSDEILKTKPYSSRRKQPVSYKEKPLNVKLRRS